MLSPSNGSDPKYIWYRRQPPDQTSHFDEYALLSKSSGDAYIAVPLSNELLKTVRVA